MKATHMPEPSLVLLGGNLQFLDKGELIPEGATYPDGSEIVEKASNVESLSAAFERQGAETPLVASEAPPVVSEVPPAPAPVGAPSEPVGVPLARVEVVQVAVPRPIIQDPPIVPPAPPSRPVPTQRPSVSPPLPASQVAAAASRTAAPPSPARLPPPAGFAWLAWPKGAAAPSLNDVPIVSGTMAEVISPSDNNLSLGGILRFEIRTDRPELNPPGESQARLAWLAVGGVKRDLGPVAMTASRDVLLGPKFAYRIVGKPRTFSVASQAVCGDGCLLVKNPDVGHYPVFLRSWDPMPGTWTRGALFFAFEGRARFVPDAALAEGVDLGGLPVISDMSMMVALGDALPMPYAKIRELAQAYLIETSGVDPTAPTRSTAERLRAAGFSEKEIAEMCPE